MALALTLTLFAAIQAQPPGARAFAFRGQVVSVSVETDSVSVANENIDGWMASMTMAYRLDDPDILAALQVGDTIEATVYDGDYTTLYNVRVEATVDAQVPLSYVCPTPGEESFLGDQPGTCPGSGAPLVPVRLVLAYSCLRVQLPLREEPGRCPIDGSDLVPVTAAMYFTCPNDSNVHETSPGLCADGSPRIKVLERRPHGDHNPRHGGAFIFMSVDQRHHLEGTFVEPGVFRVYFYDNMTQPLAVDTGVSARVTQADSNAQGIGPSIPLAPGPSADGSTLEAKIDSPAFPLRLKLFITFKPGDQEQVFDFVFEGYSVDPARQASGSDTFRPKAFSFL
ncbi:MAG: copper-binding protein [Vicinamibacterales bacterium]